MVVRGGGAHPSRSDLGDNVCEGGCPSASASAAATTPITLVPHGTKKAKGRDIPPGQEQSEIEIARSG